MDSEMSLRPRPGETPQQTVDRVVAAAKRTTPGAHRLPIQERTVHVVIDLETDDEWNRVLGQLRTTLEDAVEYIDTDGNCRRAPADCVAVKQVVV